MGALQKLKVLYSRRASPSGFFSCSAPVACPVVLPTLLSLILQVDVSDRPRPSSSDRSSSGMGILQKRKELYWLLTGSLITSQKETTYQSSWYCHLFAAHGLSLLRNFTSPLPLYIIQVPQDKLQESSSVTIFYHFLTPPHLGMTYLLPTAWVWFSRPSRIQPHSSQQQYVLCYSYAYSCLNSLHSPP